jgi:hypothetical protein
MDKQAWRDEIVDHLSLMRKATFEFALENSTENHELMLHHQKSIIDLIDHKQINFDSSI